MADSSNTRLDAAAKAIAIATAEQYRNILTLTAWDEMDATPRGYYKALAGVALAAADESERPAVERLVAALEHASMVMRAARISTASKAPNTSELLLEEAEGIDDLVAEFGQQPTALKGEQHAGD